MSEEAVLDGENDGEFYTKAQNYWKEVSATVDGMLGGFSQISSTELTTSRTFLNEIFKMKPCPGRKYAVDCGAGIGRVSKGLLLPFFDKVDLIEQDEKFASEAQVFIGKTEKLGTIYNVGLQDFKFERKYDVIWQQWVLGHLTDMDLIDFWRNATLHLEPNGIIVLKENFTSNNEIEVDHTDSSVTRPLSLMKELIQKAGLRIVRIQKQKNMPEGLFPVYIIALKPIKSSS